jgi:hypothetical protein
MPPSPTPNSFAPGEVISWGPPIEHGQRFRPGRILELVTARLELSEDESAEKLLALSNTHRFVLVDRIATSRHSTVCAAVDRVLTRDVAIKIHRSPGGEIDERVVFEARAMSRIDHSNVVRIFDFGFAEGWLYSVTELCDSDMHMWSVTRGWREILERILEAGHGIARLHAEGYVHGDIKPANILIKDGVAKIGDFGLAAKPGRAESIAGTPGYIAPEVAVGIRSASGDVFALAATAWACLFGTPPFGLPPPTAEVGAAIAVLVQRAIDGEFVAEVRKHKGLPKLVRVVLRSGLHPEPNHRPPLEVWLAELAAVLDSAAWVAKLRRRLPVLVLGACSAIALGLVVHGLADHPRRTEGSATQAEVITLEFQLEQIDDAVRRGDVDTALNALHHAYSQADELGPADFTRLGDAATRVAEMLDGLRQREDAIIAWSFAVRLYKRAGRTRRVETAQDSLRAALARAQVTAADPFQSK